MNRCKNIFNSLLSAAPALMLAAAAQFAPAPAMAQEFVDGQPLTEASAGGRNFPIGTLRGSFMLLNTPEILLDGQNERLAPGARIRSAQRMLVTPASITGQNLLVNYTRDAAGLVRDVWILTPEEASVKRETAERPMFNFWPFVANSGPRDDGKTPFDQLPKYGE